MPRPAKTQPAATPTISLIAAMNAYTRVEPKLLSLNADQLVTVYVEVPKAVQAVLSALPHLKPLREEIVVNLPNHPVSMLDELEDYALAAWYADILYTSSGDLDPKKVLEEATGLREALLVAAEALAHRNLLDSKRVAEIRKSKGQTELANDLIALAELFRNAWDKVSTKTAVEEHELDRAIDLSVRLFAAKPSGKGGAAPLKLTDSADRRARAISMVARAYEECRRAVSYLRWHEGGDSELGPSLLQKPRGRKPKGEAMASTDNGGLATGESTESAQEAS